MVRVMRLSPGEVRRVCRGAQSIDRQNQINNHRLIKLFEISDQTRHS
jgi:hypothetical protein